MSTLPPSSESIEFNEDQPVAEPPATPADVADVRLYVPQYQDWSAQIKRGVERSYCFMKNPGEDHFHLILQGEIHLTRQHEAVCLRCALRQGLITTERLFWQRLPTKKTPPVV